MIEKDGSRRDRLLEAFDLVDHQQGQRGRQRSDDDQSQETPGRRDLVGNR